MNEFILIYILLIHFLADFALQTHEQASLKSTNNTMLFYHVLTYSLTWLLGTIALLGWYSILFAFITFIVHFSTDYVTSRVVKKFFDKQDFHNGFVMIGADQILHYLQLYFTFKLILS